MADQQKGEFFAGTLHLHKLDPDTGIYGTGFDIEVDQLEIFAPSDRMEAISRSLENYGQAHTTYTRAKPTEIKLNITESNRETLAAKLSGKIVPLTRSSATLTDHPVTVKDLDGWTKIGTMYLAEEGLSVRASPGAQTPLVAGVDYKINPRLGFIRAISGGAIQANDTVYVSGTVPALNGYRILGAAQYQHEFDGYLDGMNLVSGARVIVVMPRIVVSSDAAKNFFDEKLATTSLSGRLVSPSNGDKPYYIDFPVLA